MPQSETEMFREKLSQVIRNLVDSFFCIDVGAIIADFFSYNFVYKYSRQNMIKFIWKMGGVNKKMYYLSIDLLAPITIPLEQSDYAIAWMLRTGTFHPSTRKLINRIVVNDRRQIRATYIYLLQSATKRRVLDKLAQRLLKHGNVHEKELVLAVADTMIPKVEQEKFLDNFTLKTLSKKKEEQKRRRKKMM